MKANILYMLLGICIIYACNDRELIPDATIPVANFTFSNDSCQAPCEISFANTSINADSFVWNLGDGTTSNERNVDHTYQSAGNYTVSLTATGENSITHDTSFVISILPPDTSTFQHPVASFTISNDSCKAPCTVFLINNSINAQSFSWDFGDGQSSTAKDTTHRYLTDGEYTVTLTAFGNLTSDDTSIIVSILPADEDTSNTPTANFTFANDSCEAPCTITFTNTSQNAASFIWDFGDGSTSEDRDPNHLYENSGTFTVTLIAKNLDNVSDDTSFVVTILDPSTISTLTASFEETTGFRDGTVPDTICFRNTSQNATSFLWDFGDGNTSDSSQDTVCHIYRSNGSFNVKLVARNDTEVDSFTALFSIDTPLPVADFTIGNNNCTAPCTITFTNTSENATNFSWDLGDSNNSIVENPQHIYSLAGTYSVTLTASNDVGNSSITKDVVIQSPLVSCENLPQFSISPDTDQFGTPVSIQFNGPDGLINYNYSWDFGDGIVSNEADPLHEYLAVNQTTDIEVSLTVSNDQLSCDQTKKLTLYDGPVPGTCRLTYIDESGRVVHVSPISNVADSTLVGLPAFNGLGDILDMEVDYQDRKIYVLVGSGTDPGNGGKNPTFYSSNLNGTQTSFLFSREFENKRISSFDFDPDDGLIYWLETDDINIGEYTFFRARPDASFIENIMTITEDAFMAVNQIEVNFDNDEVYYYMESEGVSFIRGKTFPENNGALFINGALDQEFSGLLFDKDTEDLYTYFTGSTNIRKYNVSDGSTFDAIVSTTPTIDRISLDKARNQLFWLDVKPLGNTIQKASLNGTNITTYVGESVGRFTLQLGCFE